MSWLNHLTKFSNEPYKHFMAKSSLFWVLRKMKHEVATEWLIGDGYADICDKTTQTLLPSIFNSFNRQKRLRKKCGINPHLRFAQPLNGYAISWITSGATHHSDFV